MASQGNSRPTSRGFGRNVTFRRTNEVSYQDKMTLVGRFLITFRWRGATANQAEEWLTRSGWNFNRAVAMFDSYLRQPAAGLSQLSDNVNNAEEGKGTEEVKEDETPETEWKEVELEEHQEQGEDEEEEQDRESGAISASPPVPAPIPTAPSTPRLANDRWEGWKFGCGRGTCASEITCQRDFRAHKRHHCKHGLAEDFNLTDVNWQTRRWKGEDKDGNASSGPMIRNKKNEDKDKKKRASRKDRDT